MEFDRKRRLLEAAKGDLKDKIKEIKANIGKREDEIEELKNVINNKCGNKA